MPVQAAQWTEFLSCPICYNEFDSSGHQPISLGCSHTVCKTCLHKLHRKACPFDQTPISTDIDLLPVNCALLQLVGAQVSHEEFVPEIMRQSQWDNKLKSLSCVFVCAHDVHILDPRCAASEPEQCSRGRALRGLQGLCGGARSLLKTDQRCKR